MRTWLMAAGLVLAPMVGAAQESDTLTQLLEEVRLLRQAMERNVEFASRTQLLTAQLSVQERRLARAQTELEGIERELQSIVADQPRYLNIHDELERAAADALDAERQRQMDFELKQIGTQIEQSQTRERELQVLQSRAVESVTVERERYEDLDNRLYQLEREMARVR